jgi:hypothetical protein
MRIYNPFMEFTMPIKSKIFSLGILLSLLLSLYQVSPAAALAPTITSVSPAWMVNNTHNEVTISGSDFTADVKVTLDSGSGPIPLALQSWSETSLVVVVPAGIPAGVYAIKVTTEDGDATFNSLTVSAPEPTATPAPFGRPQVVMDSYRISVGEIKANEDFDLVVRLHNVGQVNASNLQAVFSSPDLTPTQTGGVAALTLVGAGQKADISQKMRATGSLFGRSSVQVELNITYYDDKGVTYSERFTLNVPVKPITVVAVATPTPAGLKRAQLVITSYKSDVEILQPGSLFALELAIQNLGNAGARGVTMIVGGGSAGSSNGGTAQPGGVAGGSGEFTNFAPVGASNIQSLGDLAPGASLIATQKLIVNVSTNPGAYPMKVTFSYLDEQGNTVNDEQVITLLVYSLPSVDVSFYQPVSMLFAGQPNFLPLQIVNMGRKMSVLGSVRISASNGTLENAQSLVGPLEAGGYFTLDAMLYPDQPGPLTLTISIDYIDDFNQPRTIIQTLNLDVMEMEMPPFEPGFPEGENGYYPPFEQEETFWQKVWRFILGLFGLDSGKPAEQQPAPIYEEEPMPRPVLPQG